MKEEKREEKKKKKEREKKKKELEEEFLFHQTCQRDTLWEKNCENQREMLN